MIGDLTPGRLRGRLSPGKRHSQTYQPPLNGWMRHGTGPPVPGGPSRRSIVSRPRADRYYSEVTFSIRTESADGIDWKR